MSRRAERDLLWKDYFRDPSQWVDLRKSKVSPRHPDFKHKASNQSLWVDGWYNNSWVRTELKQRGLKKGRRVREARKEDLAKGSYYRKAKQDDLITFVSLLRACTKKKDLSSGARLHDDILRKGLLENCSDALVTMYSKCGALEKAVTLLGMHKSRDLLTWTSVIAGYAQKGHGWHALDYFERMQQEGVRSDAVAYCCVLKACGTLRATERGEAIHNEIAKEGLLEDNVVLGTALVDMYAKCGAMTKSQQVLEELHIRDVVSWNALITGFVEHGEGDQALKCFECMQGEGISPNAVTFICALKACGRIGALARGENIHEDIVDLGLLQNGFMLGTALVGMYAKCGALAKAQRVLEELSVRDVISWNALIAGYAEHGQDKEALNCFEKMKAEGLFPDAATFVSALKTCGNLRAVEKGERIHDQIAKQGILKSDMLLGTALMDMYAKCGALAKAERVLEELSARNVISWNTLIGAYAEYGQGAQALENYERMQSDGVLPDATTYVSILKACGSIGALDEGIRIHGEIAERGLLRKDIVLGNALVDMYAKCGALEKALRVLEKLPVRDVTSWTALIDGYATHDEGEQALNFLERMRQEDIAPNHVTFISILKACGCIGACDKGEQIHKEIVHQRLLVDNILLGTALVHMYAKCGALARAHRVLEELPSRNVVAWNTLMAGCTEHGKGAHVLVLFEVMQNQGLSPDAASFSLVLSACSHLGLVEEALVYFAQMSATYDIVPDLQHCACMVDLFGRVGQLDRAIAIVKQMPSCTRGSLSAILSACNKWGDQAF